MFSLGAVLYRAATGRTAFSGPHLMELWQDVLTGTPKPPHEVRPDLPPALSSLIMQLLEKNPAQRPASARAVVAEIDRVPARATATPGVQRLTARQAIEAPYAPEGRRPRLRIAAAVGLVAAGLLVAAWAAWSGWGRQTDPETQETYSGRVDMMVWSKDGQEIRKLRLGDPNALPLRKGDTVRIEAKVWPEAYLYLFWIDTEGKAVPLYPWGPEEWGTRPAAEEKRDSLELPATLNKGLTLRTDSEGMETLVLLAFSEPLAASDEEVQRWFAGLGAQRPVQDRYAAVWFENGRVVENDRRRQRTHFEIKDINDPVLRVQALLRERLGKRAAFTAAVSFVRERR
jgi:hypothetical protein